MSIEAMKLALEALEKALDAIESWGSYASEYFQVKHDLEGDIENTKASITALRQAIEQAQQDHTYGYAKSLAETIFKQHYASDEHYASGQIVWGVNDTVIGILTQIDNMVAVMVRKSEQAQQAQPVATVTSETGDSEVTMSWWHEPALPVGTKLYTSPPPRQPLTDEEILKVWEQAIVQDNGAHARLDNQPFVHFARAIEAKLKEKNT